MRTPIPGLLALALSACALTAAAQTPPAKPASGAACRAGAPLPGGGREFPVRTPVPANAVYLGEGVASVPAGKMQMLPNMPGHRRFKPPLFPNAGWDSPVLSTGQKFYEDYVGRYWCAPYLADTPDTAYPARHERAYAPPPPYEPRMARSKAKPTDEALMGRRLQLIAEAVMASKPFRNIKGASLEPVLTVEGADAPAGRCAARSRSSCTPCSKTPATPSACPTARSTAPGPARPW